MYIYAESYGYWPDEKFSPHVIIKYQDDRQLSHKFLKLSSYFFGCKTFHESPLRLKIVV